MQTHKVDVLRRVQIPLNENANPTSAGNDTVRETVDRSNQSMDSHSNPADWTDSDQYTYLWQLLLRGKWRDYDATTSAQLDTFPINQQHAKGVKISMDEAILNHTKNGKLHKIDLRRILVDVKSGKRVVWQYYNDQNQWAPVDTDLMLQLMTLSVSQSMSYQRGKWNYTIKKVSAIDCIQINSKTNTQRKYRLKMMDRDAMDNGWTSKGILCVSMAQNLYFDSQPKQ